MILKMKSKTNCCCSRQTLYFGCIKYHGKGKHQVQDSSFFLDENRTGKQLGRNIQKASTISVKILIPKLGSA